MSVTNRLQFDSPALYEICVQGQMSNSQLNLWSNMGISVEHSSDGDSPITILTGTLQDQAELAGLLNTLYEWRCSILSVNHIKERYTNSLQKEIK